MNVTVLSNHSARKCAIAYIRYSQLSIFNGITRFQQKFFSIGARYSSKFLPNRAFNGQWSHLLVFRKHRILAKGWASAIQLVSPIVVSVKKSGTIVLPRAPRRASVHDHRPTTGSSKNATARFAKEAKFYDLWWERGPTARPTCPHNGQMTSLDTSVLGLFSQLESARGEICISGPGPGRCAAADASLSQPFSHLAEECTCSTPPPGGNTRGPDSASLNKHKGSSCRLVRCHNRRRDRQSALHHRHVTLTRFS